MADLHQKAVAKKLYIAKNVKKIVDIVCIALIILNTIQLIFVIISEFNNTMPLIKNENVEYCIAIYFIAFVIKASNEFIFSFRINQLENKLEKKEVK